MDKLSDSDHVLLGYTPRDQPLGSSHRNSDVDFHDVFGGPPRRHSAVYEPRSSRAESLDSRSSLGERGSGSGSGSGSRFSDVPVFRESGSPARRRHLGSDFFSDIFPGSESSSSSPARMEQDVAYLLSPGSRMLSPTRTVPSRGEPFVGGSSLPAQLSLSMKLAKVTDQPTFNSPSHGLYKKDGSPDAFGFPSSPNASMYSSSTRTIPINDYLRNDAHSFYRQSPLSRQVSHSLDKSSETTASASLSFEVQSRKDTTSLEDYVSSNQFHFSIYKWAGKGVTLIMPSSTKEKNGSRFRRMPEVVLHGVELPPYNDKYNMPTTIIASKSQCASQDNKLLDLVMDGDDDAIPTSVEELHPVGSESKSLHIDVTEESDASAKSRRAPVTMPGGWTSGIKNLQQLLDDDKDGKGKEDKVKQVEQTKKFSEGQKNVYDCGDAKQQAGRENGMNHVEGISPGMQDVQVPLEDKVHGSRVKGKVKDFIKIFNLEASPKRKGIFETQDRRSKGKDGVKGKTENQVNSSATKIVEEEKASSRIFATKIVEEKASSRTSATYIVEEKASSKTESLVDTPIAIKENLKTETYGSTIYFDVHMINDDSPSEKEGTSQPFSEAAPEVIDATVCNAGDSHFEDLEGCVVEQLYEDQNEPLQTILHQDQIKISDAKIREWSKGKEGNIRSLLSTLQYVLWPESGWKPVPLVNIIEGPSVKRAYQKALLYLHPDKLQQKGAAMHQRYIAEKVFDILQEAWDHFNSISSF